MGERSTERTETVDDATDTSSDQSGATTSTDELLAETERLLEGGPADSSSEGGEQRTADQTEKSGSGWFGGRFGGSTAATEADEETAVADETGPSMRDRLSPGRYLSPKALLSVFGVLAIGFVGGGTALTLGGIGQLLGLAIAGFLIGFAVRGRLYLETGLTGIAIGLGSTLLGTDTGIWLPTDFGQPLLAVAAVTLLVSLLSYYFGRDLRNGIARDVDS